MNREEYLRQFAGITREMYRITEAKNSDYSSQGDALENFTSIERFREKVKAIDGIHVRMTDKFMRFGHLLDREGKVSDESIEDTLLDLANYSIIAVIHLRSLRGQPEP